jgi:hypothetical protein
MIEKSPGVTGNYVRSTAVGAAPERPLQFCLIRQNLQMAFPCWQREVEMATLASGKGGSDANQSPRLDLAVAYWSDEGQSESRDAPEAGYPATSAFGFDFCGKINKPGTGGRAT